MSRDGMIALNWFMRLRIGNDAVALTLEGHRTPRSVLESGTNNWSGDSYEIANPNLTRVLKGESHCVSGKAKACNELGSVAYECKAVLASAQIKRPEGNCSVELIDSGEIPAQPRSGLSS